MKHKILIIIIFLFFTLPANCIADELIIKLAAEPAPNLISLYVEFKFDQETNIYYWQSRKTIYPILDRVLYVKCKELNKNHEIKFFPHEKVLPKLGFEQDVLKVTNYVETLKLVPFVLGDKNKHELEKGKYSLTLIYDTKEFRRYPGDTLITPKNIVSNEIIFEIK